MHPKHDTLLNEHYRQAMLKVSELQHAETAQQSVDLLDDLVHHLTRLSDGLNKRIALMSGPSV